MADRNSVRHFLSRKDRYLIENAIREVETRTSGEIRVKVITGCTHPIRHNSDQEALEQFSQEGLDKTRDKTGVLILVILDERKIELRADKGINDKVDPRAWESVVSAIEAHFRDRRFAEGLVQGIRRVGTMLAHYFPRKFDDTNELPDGVILGR